MTKVRKRSGMKKNGIVMLKVVVEKLQKSLLLGWKSACDHDEFEKMTDSSYVPADVKEGHFAVIAEDEDGPRRFVVPLNFLTHPTFQRLLEQAAEEYGFDREGALTIPCRPSELERILAEHWQKERDPSVGVQWDSSKTLVRSC